MTRLAILAFAALAVAGSAQAQAVPPRKVEAGQTPGAQVTAAAAAVGTPSTVAGLGAAGAEAALEANRGLIKAQGSYAGQILGGAVTTEGYQAALKSNSQLLRGAKVVGHLADGVGLASGVVSVASSCSSGDVGDCVMSNADLAADVVAVAAGSTVLVPLSYQAGKLAGQGFNAGYEYVSGRSLGEDLYDVSHPDEDARIWADVERQKGAMQARAAAAYQQSAGALQQRQQAYDAEQAQIAREQAEAAQQQAMAQQQSAQTQQFMNSLMGSLAPPPAAPISPAAPLASPTGCHPGHDEAAHPGGCHQGSGTAQ